MMAAGLSVSEVRGADWPQWRGPTANGIAPDTGINKDWAHRPPTLLWKMPLSDGGYAGPAAAAGKVFIIDHAGDQDIVRALDLTTGEEVWRYSYADTAQANLGFARATPAVSEGKVYTLGRLGQLHCLDADTGALIWARNLLQDFGGRKPSWDYSMSPVIDGNKLIVVPGGPNACVAALDKHTGQTIWQGGGSDAPGYSTPVVATILGVKQYVVLTAKSVQGVHAETGQLLWRHSWVTYADVNAATPVVTGNLVCVSSGYGHGAAMLEITEQGPVVKWENRDMQCKVSSPVAYNGVLFGGGEGHFACLDPGSGQTLYKQGGFGDGSVVAVDGVLLVLFGDNGELQMMTPTNPPQVLGRITPLGGQSLTAPIIAEGKLLIRNQQALACLDLKEGG